MSVRNAMKEFNLSKMVRDEAMNSETIRDGWSCTAIFFLTVLSYFLRFFKIVFGKFPDLQLFQFSKKFILSFFSEVEID